MKPLLVRRIWQKDNYNFAIEWSDGLSQTFRLSEVQKQCSCAQCVNEATGERIVDETFLDERVRAVRIRSVGRYALKIAFTTGCSLGIYDFECLRKIGKSYG